MKPLGWNNRVWGLRITLIAFVLFVAGREVKVEAATYTVTNLNDSGLGSLRAAITPANAHMGPDTIVFTVAGTINVLTQLPDLSPSGTTIDRTTAPSYAGAPVVALRGLGHASFVPGLRITSANNDVRALQIGSFRVAIEISGASA